MACAHHHHHPHLSLEVQALPPTTCQKHLALASDMLPAALACTDHTALFRQLARSADPQGNNATIWRREKELRDRGGRNPTKPQQEAIARRRQGEIEWINEARRIERHTAALLAFLTSIRRPYLNLSSQRPGASRTSAEKGAIEKRAGVDISSEEATGTFARWADVRWLDDDERNQVDFQAHVVVKRCISRVQELEKAEEVRKRTAPLAGTSAFSRLLTLSNVDGSMHQLASDQLSAHRASITRYLSSMLADASARQRDMQERRLRATKERHRTLAASASTSNGVSGDGSGKEKSLIRGTVGGALSAALEDGKISTTNGDVSNELSAAQVQQFESESSALIKSLETDLAAVQSAEHKLVEISEMQTQLLQHLSQQAEVTDQLHDEAIRNTAEVSKGNEQLQAAKKRNREANKFLSIFLVGSGLGLLFLHWMD